MAVNKKTNSNLPDRPGPGRPKGSVNKTTSTIKAAFIEAFDRLGGGEALADWAVENQTDFYKLASKLIPTELNANVAVVSHEDALKALK